MSVSKPKKPSPAQRTALITLAVEKNARIAIRRYPEDHPQYPNFIFYCNLLYQPADSSSQHGYALQVKSFETMEQEGWIVPISKREYAKHVSYAPDRPDYNQSYGISDAGRALIGLPPKNTETTTPKETPTTDA